MALRNIRIDGDPILRKKARVVDVVDDKIRELLEDMAETMYNSDGVGLAAPQIGILKRLVTIDVGDENGLLKMVNPEIIASSGEQIGPEGCLSIPECRGFVKRPECVKFKYTDINGTEQVLEATELLAVCICHEIDHLNGILFTDLTLQGEEAQKYEQLYYGEEQ
ncbi:MAG: peptide deformylase [Peptoniphilaceae bacterium]|uniref:peptide deformylase n=1 Tax=Parvimonas sp. TaxID=1944660 RepID=UPI0025FB9C44|nr:peptide deformylase [Parvimonas sp.]MCI5997595.1 peptide deformylase [Parvimonas sp.]MDD7765190.1 peptide deformylase [Peptoniphilaceae bacterium]MDY3051193.1 peptide deformylase [Parvimonas sp.]